METPHGTLRELLESLPVQARQRGGERALAAAAARTLPALAGLKVHADRTRGGMEYPVATLRISWWDGPSVHELAAAHLHGTGRTADPGESTVRAQVNLAPGSAAVVLSRDLTLAGYLLAPRACTAHWPCRDCVAERCWSLDPVEPGLYQALGAVLGEPARLNRHLCRPLDRGAEAAAVARAQALHAASR